MSESQANHCEFYLIKAWTPFYTQYLKADLYSISNLSIEGLHEEYSIDSIANINDKAYLMNIYDYGVDMPHLYRVDIEKGTSEKIGMIPKSASLIVRDDIIVIGKLKHRLSVFKLDGSKVGTMDVTIKFGECRNNWHISQRWIQLYQDNLIS